MLRTVSAIMAAVLIMAAPTAMAEARKPVLTPAKGKVTVILRIEDNAIMSLPEVEAVLRADPSVSLAIRSDPARLKAEAERQLKANLINASDHSVTLASYDPQATGPRKLKYRTMYGTSVVDDAATGARWMVGQIEAGDIYIQRFTNQSLWHLCYNTQTAMTTAAAGDVILFGTFDTGLNRGIIENLVRTGRLPGSIGSAQQIAGDGQLFGQTLEGFVAADADADVARATRFATAYAPGV